MVLGMPVTDFDFLPGAWRIANRRLVNTLDPECTEWEEFDATSVLNRSRVGGTIQLRYRSEMADVFTDLAIDVAMRHAERLADAPA